VKIKTSQGLPPATEIARPKTAEELLRIAEETAAAERRRRALGGCPADLAAFATGLCALVYHPFREIRERLATADAREITGFDRKGTQAVGFFHGERLWLVFRGSESFPETELFADWGHDLMCPPAGWPARHFGFARAWEKIRDPVLSWVRTQGNGRGLVLSGHSLGGALALMAANDLAPQARIEAVITFGAPRVGTRGWRKRFHSLPIDPDGGKTLGDVTFRICNRGDIVTCVPPLIFVHCGEEISAAALKPQLPGLSTWNAISLASQVDIPGPGVLGRLAYGYAQAKRAWPYAPLNLLLDLIFAIVKTAPEHFMIHYAPAFPERAFPDLWPPTRPPFVWSAGNVALRLAKYLIVALSLGMILGLGYLLYRASPQIALGLLIATVSYALFPLVIPVSANRNEKTSR